MQPSSHLNKYSSDYLLIWRTGFEVPWTSQGCHKLCRKRCCERICTTSTLRFGKFVILHMELQQDYSCWRVTLEKLSRHLVPKPGRIYELLLIHTGSRRQRCTGHGSRNSTVPPACLRQTGLPLPFPSSPGGKWGAQPLFCWWAHGAFHTKVCFLSLSHFALLAAVTVGIVQLLGK